eukprot:3864690-Rhodomonas_salina.1
MVKVAADASSVPSRLGSRVWGLGSVVNDLESRVESRESIYSLGGSRVEGVKSRGSKGSRVLGLARV